MILSICRRYLKIRGDYICRSGVQQNASHKSFMFSTKASHSPSSSPNLKISTSLAVESLLRSYGFTDAHISELNTRCPNVFTLNAKNNILPKLKFFISVGLSNTDLPKFVLGNNYLLSSSLENQIIPTCNYLLNTIPLTKDELARVLKLYPGILVAKRDTILAPNIELLREMGLSPADIAFMVIRTSRALCRNHDAFKSCIGKILSMGLQPSMKRFVQAVEIICGISEEKLEKKMMLYKSYGISDDEILLAFKKQPTIVGISESTISKKMEFFINELKWTPSDIAHTPDVLILNLDKRIARRSRVLEMLVEKGLKHKDYLYKGSFLKLSEKKFLDRYIYKFANDLPEILDMYDVGQSRRRGK